MESLGATREQLDLRGVASLAEVERRVKERAEAIPAGSWITGRNWDQSLWPGGEFPDGGVLDRAAPGRRCGSDASTATPAGPAPKRCGWRKSQRTPRPRRAARSSATAGGNPTGVFIDGAMSLVGKAVPASGKDDIKRHLLAAQQVVLEQGLTSVHDAGISRAVADAYRELDREGKLVVRIYGMASLPAGGELAFAEPAAAGVARKREVRAAGDQALHRRRDGLARRASVRAVQR